MGSAEQSSELKAEAAGAAGEDASEAAGPAPDSPSKQLPDQITFFSGNPSVEIVHGIMHLYKTKLVSLDENIHCSNTNLLF